MYFRDYKKINAGWFVIQIIIVKRTNLEKLSTHLQYRHIFKDEQKKQQITLNYNQHTLQLLIESGELCLL